MAEYTKDTIKDIIKRENFNYANIVSRLSGIVEENDYAENILRGVYSALSTSFLFSKLIKEGEKDIVKLYAEVCYLLAQKLKENSKTEARELARESIRLYERLNIQTLEDSTAILWRALPSLMHDNVVKERLKKLLGE